VVWTAAGLGQALYGLGNVEKAQKLVVDALWTAVSQLLAEDILARS